MCVLVLARAVALVALGAGLARAAVVHVAPGPGTPVQDAIDGAVPGDTVRLAPGVYREWLFIRKRLRLVGDGPDQVTIDADCRFGTVITVAEAERVTIKGLRAVGGTVEGILAYFVDRLTVADTETQGHFLGGCASEETGISISAARGVRLLGNRAAGFFGAGIWLIGAADEGPYRVVGNTLTANAAGVLVQGFGDVVPRLTVRANDASRNLVDGIVLDGALGARVARNTVAGNVAHGIRLTGTAESLVVNNTITGNAPDVSDDGTTNCWRGNVFATGTLPPGGCQ